MQSKLYYAHTSSKPDASALPLISDALARSALPKDVLCLSCRVSACIMIAIGWMEKCVYHLCRTMGYYSGGPTFQPIIHRSPKQSSEQKLRHRTKLRGIRMLESSKTSSEMCFESQQSTSKLNQAGNRSIGKLETSIICAERDSLQTT